MPSPSLSSERRLKPALQRVVCLVLVVVTGLLATMAGMLGDNPNKARRALRLTDDLSMSTSTVEPESGGHPGNLG